MTLLAAFQVGGASAQTVTGTLTFAPVADAYVDAAEPATTFGTTGSLKVDNSSVKQSFMKFNISGIGTRYVSDVKLRLYQKNVSPFGGRVLKMSDNTWDETVTWNKRPAIDGPLLG